MLVVGRLILSIYIIYSVVEGQFVPPGYYMVPIRSADSDLSAVNLLTSVPFHQMLIFFSLSHFLLHNNENNMDLEWLSAPNDLCRVVN